MLRSPVGLSACENLFRVCGFPSDLWRCDTDAVDGGGRNAKGFFPGQPFSRNEFTRKSKDPLPTCTPSIKGAAPLPRGSLSVSVLIGFVWAGFL